MDDAAIRAALVRQFEDGRDLDETHELYHEDAILEFPQSGERFVGLASFLTWRKQYPASVDYRIRRITGEGELWVIELLVSYNGSPPMFGVSIIRFRGDRIARESIYVAEAVPGLRGATRLVDAVRPAGVGVAVGLASRVCRSASRADRAGPYWSSTEEDGGWTWRTRSR